MCIDGEKMDLKDFEPYVEKGLIRKVISPCGRLVLFNYTDKCVFEKAWDRITLNARGTVYEISTGTIRGRAFKKFFNFTELPPGKQKAILNGSGIYKTYQSFEKSDGSLGIIYFYDGEWRINTRGSFTSDQAIKGAEILKNCNLENVPTGFTHLVEIIYPENKIIVK